MEWKKLTPYASPSQSKITSSVRIRIIILDQLRIYKSPLQIVNYCAKTNK